jgi:hypothetical protein
LAAAGGGAAIAALYGVHGSRSATGAPTAYLVDMLFRPESGTGAARASSAQTESGAVEQGPHAEAERILQAGLMRGEELSPDDRARLSDLTAAQAGISRHAAAARTDRMQADVRDKTRKAAEAARKAASYGSLWLSLSLLFGAIVSIFAAISARLEDDRAL